MRGEVTKRMLITLKVVPVTVEEMVDLDKLTFKCSAPVFGELLKRIEADDVGDVAIFRNDGQRIKDRR